MMLIAYKIIPKNKGQVQFQGRMATFLKQELRQFGEPLKNKYQWFEDLMFVSDDELLAEQPKEIGGGGFATVFSCKLKNSDQSISNYALKSINGAENFYSELRVNKIYNSLFRVNFFF